MLTIIYAIAIANTYAEIRTFVREYTYRASEADSKLSCRTIALEQVKRLLLEELGTYLESQTEGKNFQLTKDQITTLTAGIVRTEIVEEKWTGEIFWIKAKIAADPDTVIKSIEDLRSDRQKAKELEKSRRMAAEYLQEVERLKGKLSSVKADIGKKEEYNEVIKKLSATDWFEKGISLSDEPSSALDAFNKTIELNPKMVEAYFSRGLIYVYQNKFYEALDDCKKAIELTPDVERFPIYAIRSFAHAGLGNYTQALSDSEKAIKLCPYSQSVLLAFSYLSRGYAHGMSNNFYQAISDFNKALEVSPKFPVPYAYLGHIYFRLGNHKEAVKSYNAYIDSIPMKNPEIYHNLGRSYYFLGNYELAIMNFKIAARLGHSEAQIYLRSEGIKW